MTADTALQTEAEAFALRLTNLTRGVLGQGSPRFDVRSFDDRLDVTPLDDKLVAQRIPVMIDGAHAIDLSARFLCCWDSPGRYLATDEATVHVYAVAGSEPLLRYEYVRTSRTPPGAHLQIHAHRDEIAYLMLLSERKQGKPAARLRAGKAPRLSAIHLPVGGHRMRPALEDVLVLLQAEFGVDTEPGWEQVIEEHRREWRLTQLKAAVRDAPETAAGILRELGYTVGARPEGLADRKDPKLFWP